MLENRLTLDLTKRKGEQVSCAISDLDTCYETCE